MKQAAFEYEFGGPVGTALNIVLLPVIVLALAHWSAVGRITFEDSDRFLCPGCDNPMLLLRCGVCYLTWFLVQVVFERCLPGEVVEGAPILNNPQIPRLQYTLNGHLCFWVTLMICLLGWPTINDDSERLTFGAFPYSSLVYEHFAPVALVASVLCFLLSVVLYASSFVGRKILAPGGNSGVLCYDLFMGRELNPRFGSFDWKFVCELRPGLLLWMMLNIANAYAQYEHLGYTTGSMMLVNLFHGFYVWDALFHERAILTTMDITTDGFGFMLVFGDLAWVPFTYSIQSRYLVYHDPHLSIPALTAIVAFHMFGFWIFRGANGQKDAFRRNPADPKLAHLQFLQTKRGTKLLVSGWWGLARKINYTGDYIMGLSWCLLCGFDSIVPYFYAIYFLVLLVHRSERDDALCAEKYGADWETYKKAVPYRFVPRVV